MKILLAQPRGFCAGVDRAIAIVERALAVHGAPIYVRHEIVHNKHVVNSLREKGSIFVNEIDEVPDGSVLVFSAHGVPKAVEEKARARDLTIYDATCPLVTKVHMEVTKMHKQGYRIIMIGHAGHPEVEGTVGQVDSDINVIEKPAQVWDLEVENPEKVAYVSQTTISYDDAKELIQELKKKKHLTYMFISHDLSVVKYISDRIAVMYLGRIVEIAEKNELYNNPQHPYTKALLSAIPIPDVDNKMKREILTGDVPSPLNPPSGCYFHTRCKYATERCKTECPALHDVGNGHMVACHLT